MAKLNHPARHLLIGLAIILLAHCVFNGAQAYDGPFLQFSVGVHDEKSAQPEVTLEAPLGGYGFGYVWQTDYNATLTLEYQHISGLLTAEQGRGINAIWLRKTFWFSP